MLRIKENFRKYAGLFVAILMVLSTMIVGRAFKREMVYAESYSETIISDREIVISDYYSPLYVVDAGDKLVLENVAIVGDGATVIDKLLQVSVGACLELRNVTISNVKASYAIYADGGVIAENLTIDESVGWDIYFNSTTDNFVLGKVSIDAIYLNKGYITANGSTRIAKEINLQLGSANEIVGTPVVKGDNTFAGYYLDKFNYVGSARHTTNEGVVVDCLLDYVGSTDEIVCSCEGEDCLSTCVKQKVKDNLAAKNLATGDIVFTSVGGSRHKVGETINYYYVQYATARAFLEESTGSNYYLIDNVNYDSMKPMYKTNMAIVDNYKYIGVETDALYLVEGNFAKAVATNTISINVVTKENSEVAETRNMEIHAGEDKLMFIEKPEGVMNYTLNVSDNLAYDVIVDNDALLGLLIHTDKAESVTTASIIADFLTSTTTNVDVVMQTDLIYNGRDRKDDINPHYVSDSEEIGLEYEIYCGGEICTEIKDAGEYVIKFINVPEDIILSEDEMTVRIAQKELTIAYSNYSDLVYDKTTKNITAILNGVCDGDTVNLALANASNINAGSYVVTASIDNANYVIKSGDESLSYVIDKASIDFTNIEFTIPSVEYSGIMPEFNVTNLPDVVTAEFIPDDEIFLVGSYDIVAILTLNDTANYYPLSKTSLTATLVITHAKIDVSQASFEGRTETYSGAPYSLDVTGLPSEIASRIYIDYSAENLVNAGTYTITATLSTDTTKYILEGDTILTATLVIDKADADMSKVVFADNTVTYDKNVKSLVVSGVYPSFVAIDSYVNNSHVNVGEYVVSVKFKSLDSNYNAPSDMTALLTIEKRVLALSLKPNDFTYDGTAKTVQFNIDNVCDGDIVNISTMNTTNINAGTYSAIAVSVEDNDNYTLPADTSFSYIIAKAMVNMSGVVLQDIEKEYDGTEFVPSLTGVLPGMVTPSYAYSTIKNVGEYTVVVSFGVNSNYIAPANMTAKVVVKPRPIVLTFDNYTGLVVDGAEKSISVVISGLISGESEELEVAYSARPIEAGIYTCVVTLKNPNSNYVISGNNAQVFEILAKDLTYAKGDYVLIVKTDGISTTTEMKLEKNTVEESVTNTLYARHNAICGYDAFTISIDSEETEKFALKTDTINFNSKNKICLYKIVGSEIVNVDYEILDGMIYFDANNNDKFILVEVQTESANVGLIIILSIVGTLAVSGGVVSTIVILKKRKKAIDKN